MRLTLLLAVGIDVGVGEDAEEPRLEVRALLVGLKGSEGLHVGLLNEVVGIGRITRFAHRVTVELVEVWQSLLDKERLLGFECGIHRLRAYALARRPRARHEQSGGDRLRLNLLGELRQGALESLMIDAVAAVRSGR